MPARIRSRTATTGGATALAANELPNSLKLFSPLRRAAHQLSPSGPDIPKPGSHGSALLGYSGRGPRSEAIMRFYAMAARAPALLSALNRLFLHGRRDEQGSDDDGGTYRKRCDARKKRPGDAADYGETKNPAK